ncbi:MAG: aminoacyl-tRNA hydrolase [Phycisphaerae bacterium]|nr:aminoacyl-tRNA hydrolase [Phycisphaerae bacterium]
MSVPSLNITDLTPWCEVQFSRSAGPGGQNVNKVSTRATVLLDFEACTRLSDWQKARIRGRLRTRLARDGRLRVVSQVERTQARNRNRAERRLIELLAEAFTVQKSRRPTAPTRGSRERRLEAKRQRGDVKRQRRSRPGADE